ncbi:DUF389 domain-containing protein [Lentilactobacillus otakiensis]|uniref:DUF389 domain-containing protein n=1 Tax=Lentilactobacillus otakiensis TaxID=481720 RepID=UPI000412A020|nr:DUF389 domain-containing protein [Lentilactobacillus otakiensis]KRL09937.1 hypothetical protein FD05_GL000924 [Lentilactobacillus otakiensis DSM 19908 = JCM 15040]MBZ3776291.1 DUF389 domain-containing protein [Lentilactobacillus otakiensis]MDV3517285.1 DUF389 domain-containing protein [Lentilactobacillus otakiensis]
MQQISTNTLNTNIQKDLNFTWSTQAILFCAIIIACIGLNVDSAPVVIGAMLISPLMAPIVGIGYGLGNSNPKLLSKATKLFLIQVVIGVVGATIYFFVSPLNTASAQLLARTQPTLWDVLIAFFGGFAGVISSAKKDGGNVVPGVAIATALMPPLCTVGYGISHLNSTFILGAGYLFLINAFFIALATASGTIFFRIRSGEKLNVSFKQQALILLIAIIIVIPSSISAYSIVHNSYIDTQLSQFIDAKLSNQYIAKQAVSGKTIQLSVIGQRLNDNQVKQLKASMKHYHLDGYQLSLTQLTKGNYITPKEFQDYMKQTDNTDTVQTNANAKADDSLTTIQNDLNEKYAKDISNIYVGQVKDKANTSKQLIAIQLSDKGAGNQNEIEKSANQLVKDNNVDAVVQFVSDNGKS